MVKMMSSDFLMLVMAVRIAVMLDRITVVTVITVTVKCSAGSRMAVMAVKRLF
jgi:hypothetical protein